MSKKVKDRMFFIVMIIIIFLLLFGIYKKDEAEKKEDEIYKEEYESIIKSRDWGYDEDEALIQYVSSVDPYDNDEETKMLITLVILNRVWTEGYPRTVQDSIESLSGSATSYIIDGITERDEETVNAVARVKFDGWDESYGALYFTDNAETASYYDSEYKFVCKSGNFWFYR